jgi:hypothetical protein
VVNLIDLLIRVKVDHSSRWPSPCLGSRDFPRGSCDPASQVLGRYTDDLTVDDCHMGSASFRDAGVCLGLTTGWNRTDLLSKLRRISSDEPAQPLAKGTEAAVGKALDGVAEIAAKAIEFVADFLVTRPPPHTR